MPEVACKNNGADVLILFSQLVDHFGRTVSRTIVYKDEFPGLVCGVHSFLHTAIKFRDVGQFVLAGSNDRISHLQSLVFFRAGGCWDWDSASKGATDSGRSEAGSP